LAVSSGGFLPEEDSLGFTSMTGVCVTEGYGSTETGGVATRVRGLGEQTWTPYDYIRWKTRGERLCVQSPFLSPGLQLDDEGYFVTGDRARAEQGGTFTLLGRVDGIVKVAGKRVDLEAVEARVRALPGVRDAYVLALPANTMRETEIVCLAVPEGDVPDEQAFRESLRSVLEPSALPRRVRWVVEIPLTPMGKRDRERAGRLFSDPKSGKGDVRLMEARSETARK
jgi:acyl-coenzyme A synthetase/AMP-(fatty) acid ligase